VSSIYADSDMRQKTRRVLDWKNLPAVDMAGHGYPVSWHISLQRRGRNMRRMGGEINDDITKRSERCIRKNKKREEEDR